MATFQVSPPESFDFDKPAEWPRWLQRYERFASASGLNAKEEVQQVNTLIYCMGSKADEIMATFGLTNEQARKIKTVKGKFQNHFIVRRNVIFERAKFNARKQQPGEPVETFITALYGLVEYCEYRGMRDEMLRDRIVVGILDTKVAEKLQLDAELTLEKAITQVRQSEAIKSQQET